MTKNFSLLLLLSLSLAGCASRGFNRGELRNQVLGYSVVTDTDVQKALALKPQLPKPFRLAVYFKQPDDQLRRGHAWHWTGEDKKKFLSLADELKATGEVSAVFTLSDSLVTATDLASLRVTAAKHGADALMVVSGVTDVDNYTNNWGWTYIGLVTTLFVPASKTDVLFMARAAMWDVRNEFLYMAADAESEKQQTRPALFRDEKAVVQAAKTESVDLLRGEIANMIQGLKQAKKTM